MEKQYLMFDIQDSRSDVIAEVLANKTCKKILSLLAEKEMSESDVVKELGLPANTAHYNMQKLVASGFVEQASKFFWSSKGKRVIIYKLSNKKVVISPKTSFKGILPAFIVTGIAAIAVKVFTASKQVAYSASQSTDVAITKMAEGTAAGLNYGAERIAVAPIQPIADAAIQAGSLSSIAPWSWFIFGAWAALLVFLLFNIRRNSSN
jgi:DNA-binding transcriptional ArsR family regulator